MRVNLPFVGRFPDVVSQVLSKFAVESFMIPSRGEVADHGNDGVSVFNRCTQGWIVWRSPDVSGAAAASQSPGIRRHGELGGPGFLEWLGPGWHVVEEQAQMTVS